MKIVSLSVVLLAGLVGGLYGLVGAAVDDIDEALGGGQPSARASAGVAIFKIGASQSGPSSAALADFAPPPTRTANRSTLRR